jgi:tetratricopeptide (TPR) repeat protein
MNYVMLPLRISILMLLVASVLLAGCGTAPEAVPTATLSPAGEEEETPDSAAPAEDQEQYPEPAAPQTQDTYPAPEAPASGGYPAPGAGRVPPPMPLPSNAYPAPELETLTDPAAIVDLIDQLAANGDYATALVTANEALERDPAIEILLARAKLLNEMNRFPQARADFAAVLEQEPDNLDARIARASMNRRLVILDEAMEDVEYVLERQPDNIEALTERARIYIFQDNFDAALNDVEQVIELDSDYAPIYAVQARAYQKMGDFEQAVAAYDQATTLEPSAVEVTFDYAMLLLGLGEPAAAREQFRAVLEHGDSRVDGEVMYRASTQLSFITPDEEE